MAAPLITIIAAAALGGPGNGAQAAYMQCLMSETEAALTKHVSSEDFARGAQRVCESETVVYRRMAIAAMIGGAGAATPAVANARFDKLDRDNRMDMINRFETRLRLRHGPSRIANLAGGAQED
jgi:hypothetical protein